MDLTKLSAGKKPPEEVNVLIEIPHGSAIKYEIDKDTGFLTVDRFGYTAMGYPANYGFIPNTLSEDGDPIDVLVIASQVLSPGVVIPVRPIGMLEMEDEEGIDTKIIAVPTVKVDPFNAHINDISDIDKSTQDLIKHYFNHYKELEPGKWVKTRNLLDKNAAYDAIKKAMK
jgi:inorganic pyrophosphatase